MLRLLDGVEGDCADAMAATSKGQTSWPVFR